jgi:hypothetical protein
VTPPAVSMKIRDGLSIGGAGEAEPWLLDVRDGILLIDPGIGTAPKPDAGPSSGQVPRVALDESSEIVARCLRWERWHYEDT